MTAFVDVQAPNYNKKVDSFLNDTGFGKSEISKATEIKPCDRIH